MDQNRTFKLKSGNNKRGEFIFLSVRFVKRARPCRPRSQKSRSLFLIIFNYRPNGRSIRRQLLNPQVSRNHLLLKFKNSAAGECSKSLRKVFGKLCTRSQTGSLSHMMLTTGRMFSAREIATRATKSFPLKTQLGLRETSALTYCRIHEPFERWPSLIMALIMASKHFRLGFMRNV